MNLLFSLVGGLIQLIGKLLFQYYGWVIVVGVLGFLIWRNRRREQWFAQTEFEILKLELSSKDTSDNGNQTAEALIEALHGIYKERKLFELIGDIQEHISLEISAVNGSVNYYLWLPKQLHKQIEEYIKHIYPNIVIQTLAHDYLPKQQAAQSLGGWEIGLKNDSLLQLQTYSDKTDSKVSIDIANNISKANNANQWLSLQILIEPVGDRWKSRASSVATSVKNGNLPKVWTGELAKAPKYLASKLVGSLRRLVNNQITIINQATLKPKLNAIEQKITKQGYSTVIRSLCIGNSDADTDSTLKSLYGSINQLSNSSNGFSVRRRLTGDEAYSFFRARYLRPSKDILNSQELASIFCLQASSSQLTATDDVSVNSAKSPEIHNQSPSDDQLLPETITQSNSANVSLIGSVKTNGHVSKFGLSREDRSHHLYVIGQSGTGKSYLLKLLAISDMHYDYGLAIIDAHGNFVKHLKQYIPSKRQKDVVNIESGLAGIGFNPLADIAPALRAQVTSDIVEALGRLFPKGLNDQTEYLLRYCVLALSETPQAWLGDILRLIQDKEYRVSVASSLTDPVVHTFWLQQFENWSEHNLGQAINPVVNRIGELVNNTHIAELLNPQQNLDFNAIISKRKILLVNLSRSTIGEANSGVFGALLLSQLRRAALAQPQLKPFYLYVDNFQNYATPTFAEMLAEARSIGLNITLTNQFVGQMPEEVREAVFGNVGSVISFRLGPDDAQYLVPYFAPSFSAQDMVNLHDRHFVANLSVNGAKIPVFRATTLSLPNPSQKSVPNKT